MVSLVRSPAAESVPQLVSSGPESSSEAAQVMTREAWLQTRRFLRFPFLFLVFF